MTSIITTHGVPTASADLDGYAFGSGYTVIVSVFSKYADDPGVASDAIMGAPGYTYENSTVGGSRINIYKWESPSAGSTAFTFTNDPVGFTGAIWSIWILDGVNLEVAPTGSHSSGTIVVPFGDVVAFSANVGDSGQDFTLGQYWFFQGSGFLDSFTRNDTGWDNAAPFVSGLTYSDTVSENAGDPPLFGYSADSSTNGAAWWGGLYLLLLTDTGVANDDAGDQGFNEWWDDLPGTSSDALDLDASLPSNLPDLSDVDDNIDTTATTDAYRDGVKWNGSAWVATNTVDGGAP